MICNGTQLFDGIEVAVYNIESATATSELAPPRSDEVLRGTFDTAVLPDGRHFVTAGIDGAVRLRDLGGGVDLGVLAKHDDSVFAVCVFPDGRRIASAGYDRSLIVSDVESRLRLATF